MIEKEIIQAIDFFNKLNVYLEDITTEEQKEEKYKVVIAEYLFEGKSFKTKPLWYRRVDKQDRVDQLSKLQDVFGVETYWLDKSIHKWPQSTGGTLEKPVIETMINSDDSEFRNLLKLIANDNKTGFLQQITREGKDQQYGFNLENNNHWHDLILLIKEIIRLNGEKPDNSFFSSLIFKWNEVGRRSLLTPEFGNRKFIWDLIRNIKASKNHFMKKKCIKLLKNKHQIILQGPPGTGKTRLAKDIAEQIIFNTVSEDKKGKQKENLESTEQFELIQFHPSYSYEDFVRGIVAKNEDGKISYATENKILGSFAKSANESNLTGGIDDFNKAWHELVQDINNKKVEKVGSSDVLVTINSQNNIRFNSPVATYEKTYELYKFGKTDLKYETYQKIVLDHLKKEYKLKDYEKPTNNDLEPKNYVLVIDEINRANLPAVLGELIYALEYRGEEVKSMYATLEEGNSLVLPENLYIIGTMNTADRSVGQIDYAIKRRFSFVTVPPKASVIKLKEGYDLFIKVENLFNGENNYLSPDFDAKDVQLGHSYFMAKNIEELGLKLEYDIKPILLEYIKDGVLLPDAKEEIETLKVE